MRVALILEYEGSRYHGFQYQANAPSVQAEVEQALFRLTRERVRVRAASRTDTGVHAMGQAVAFDTQASYPPQVFQEGLNAYLPRDIAVRAAYRVREEFDPRRDALSRHYRYTILNQEAPSPLWRRFAHRVPGPLDTNAMHHAAQQLLGCHDFRAFSGPLGEGQNTLRRMLCASVRRQDNLIRLELVASAFLPHQVRRIAGALVQVGRGKLDQEGFAELIDPVRPALAGPALPPHGLCLVQVTFADFPPKDKTDATDL